MSGRSSRSIASGQALLGELAESAVGDRFGLIAFAGTPVPKCPPTADPAVSPCPATSRPGPYARGGSLPGDAAEAASFLADDRRQFGHLGE